MPSAVWSGVISFGLVSVPVQLYGVSEDHTPRSHMVHKSDGGRVRYKRICEAEGREIPFEEIARGLEVGTNMVVITDRDLDNLPTPERKTATIEAFVPTEQIDPVVYRKPYFVVPEKAGLRPYALLRDALSKAGRAAVVRFAMRDRESLALLRPKDNMILLETLYWPDEVRQVPFEAPEAQADQAEAAATKALIEALSDDFHPETYRDHRVEALNELIEAKIAGREVKRPPAAPDAGAKVTDLLSALQESVEAAKRTRTGQEKPPAKKRSRKAA